MKLLSVAVSGLLFSYHDVQVTMMGDSVCDVGALCHRRVLVCKCVNRVL